MKVIDMSVVFQMELLLIDYDLYNSIDINLDRFHMLLWLLIWALKQWNLELFLMKVVDINFNFQKKLILIDLELYNSKNELNTKERVWLT